MNFENKPKGNFKELFGDSADYLLDTLKENAVTQAKENLPFLKSNTEKMQKSRGASLEIAITIEHIYNCVLSFMGVNKEEIFSLTFGNKTFEMIKIIERYVENNDWKANLTEMIKEVNTLRNMYAHIPQDYQNEILRFNQDEKYYYKNSKKYLGFSLEDINKKFESISKVFIDELYKSLKILILTDIKYKWEIQKE
jgi:hypothetical protein